jgi:hypothetical protein
MPLNGFIYLLVLAAGDLVMDEGGLYCDVIKLFYLPFCFGSWRSCYG